MQQDTWLKNTFSQIILESRPNFGLVRKQDVKDAEELKIAFRHLLKETPGFFLEIHAYTVQFGFGETISVEVRLIILDSRNTPNFRYGNIWLSDLVELLQQMGEEYHIIPWKYGQGAMVPLERLGKDASYQFSQQYMEDIWRSGKK